MNPEATRTLVSKLYKDEKGDPIILTNGQLQIFSSIAYRETPRLQIKCHTRYGKSLTVALAALTRVCAYPEKWAIVAKHKDKAQIIQNYVIEHIFDNEGIAAKFKRDSRESDEEIRRSRNRSRLTFKVGEDDDGRALFGELYVCSASAALGYGAPNVIVDEAAFVDNDEMALVMRMLGDHADDNFLCKIGNPFRRNHFLDSDIDPNFRNINITGSVGVQEGRITQDFLDEMSKFSYYSVLYDNEFPTEDEMDDSGWLSLMTDSQLKEAMARTLTPMGRPRLGVDVARGGRNFNCWSLRRDNWAKKLRKNRDNDLMSVVGTTIELAREYSVAGQDIFVDDVGVGGGVSDRLRERGYAVTAVQEGGRATEDDMKNVRAQMYAGKDGLMNWLIGGAMLEPDPDWIELTKIKYKKDSASRTQIMPKDDMRKYGNESPDVADSLALTFAEPAKRRMKQVDSFSSMETLESRLGIIT